MSQHNFVSWFCLLTSIVEQPSVKYSVHIQIKHQHHANTVLIAHNAASRMRWICLYHCFRVQRKHHFQALFTYPLLHTGAKPGNKAVKPTTTLRANVSGMLESSHGTCPQQSFTASVLRLACTSRTEWVGCTWELCPLGTTRKWCKHSQYTQYYIKWKILTILDQTLPNLFKQTVPLIRTV